MTTDKRFAVLRSDKTIFLCSTFASYEEARKYAHEQTLKLERGHFIAEITEYFEPKVQEIIIERYQFMTRTWGHVPVDGE